MSSTLEYASFFVRLWRSRSAGGSTQIGKWHGEVEHVQSGMKWEFENASDLLQFLGERIVDLSAWESAEQDA